MHNEQERRGADYTGKVQQEGIKAVNHRESKEILS